jgi:hypothetical protein
VAEAQHQNVPPFDWAFELCYNTFLNAKGAQMYSIECINTMQTVVNYCAEAVAEYEQGLGDGIEKYTDRFEAEYAESLKGTTTDDIGGLIVYLRESKPVMVYDYENFCAWDLQ